MFPQPYKQYFGLLKDTVNKFDEFRPQKRPHNCVAFFDKYGGYTEIRTWDPIIMSDVL